MGWSKSLRFFDHYSIFGLGDNLISLPGAGPCSGLNAALLTGGLVVIGVGLLLVVSGLVWVAVVARRKLARELTARAGISDLTELFKALTEFIRVVGVDVGVPLIVMILGMFLVSLGASLATTGGT